MKYDAELVEQIVREVIRRLTADGHSVQHSPGSATPVAQQRSLNVADRLITLATLQGKLEGITQITIPRRSVVTPAARDELNQRRIDLNREP